MFVGQKSLCLTHTVSFHHIQSVSVTAILCLTYSQCLSQTVCVSQRQSVSVTDSLSVSQAVCVCLIHSVSVTKDSLYLYLSQTLFLIVLGQHINNIMHGCRPDFLVKFPFFLHRGVVVVPMVPTLWTPGDRAPWWVSGRNSVCQKMAV